MPLSAPGGSVARHAPPRAPAPGRALAAMQRRCTGAPPTASAQQTIRCACGYRCVPTSASAQSTPRGTSIPNSAAENSEPVQGWQRCKLAAATSSTTTTTTTTTGAARRLGELAPRRDRRAAAMAAVFLQELQPSLGHRIVGQDVDRRLCSSVRLEAVQPATRNYRHVRHLTRQTLLVQGMNVHLRVRVWQLRESDAGCATIVPPWHSPPAVAAAAPRLKKKEG